MRKSVEEIKLVKDWIKEECLLLNEYITEGRYPGDLPFESKTEKDARDAIEAASKIEEFVLENINFPYEDELEQSDSPEPQSPDLDSNGET